MTQGLRFDPDGDYVRRYVPELRGLPGQGRARALERAAAGTRLPRPVVDHAEERDESLRRYAALKEQ